MLFYSTNSRPCKRKWICSLANHQWGNVFGSTFPNFLSNTPTSPKIGHRWTYPITKMQTLLELFFMLCLTVIFLGCAYAAVGIITARSRVSATRYKYHTSIPPPSEKPNESVPFTIIKHGGDPSERVGERLKRAKESNWRKKGFM